MMIKALDRKLDFACLTIFPGFVYWTLDYFYINWLAPPPGVPYCLWLPLLAEIFGNFLDIRVAARSLFVSTAQWLCEKHNSASTDIFPTLRDVFNAIRSKKYPAPSHQARYQETLLNRIIGVLRVFGDHICSNRRINWPRFLTTDWAISIHGLPTDYQNLFITVIVAQIMLYRIYNNLRSASLVDLFVFDEAATMFKKWYEAREGTYLLTDYLAQAREFGVGFLISTQTISNLADSVLTNTAIKVLVGGAGLGADYDYFASATGLTPDQKDFLKSYTLPGMACARDYRYPHPFTVEVPKIA